MTMPPRPALRVCVFCGSRLGHHHQWAGIAADVGQAIASRGWGLVYGAGRWGLMGTVAQAAIEEGGYVLGVIPDYLTKIEPVLPGIHELYVVQTMIERKIKMMDESQAFLVLPGGIGTLEELFEVWTGLQTGGHQKPIVLANLEGYYDTLLAFVKEACAHGFLTQGHIDKLQVADSIEGVFALLEKSLRGPAAEQATIKEGR